MLTSQQVAAVDFPVVRWREGYEIDDVRALLDRIRAALEGYEGRGTISDLTARDVERTRFQATKFRAGWDRDVVDAFLDEAIATLTAYEQVG